MGRYSSIIPVAPVHSLLKTDPAMKVSDAAAKLVVKHLEHFGKSLAVLAKKNAVHRGKMTIDKEDVVLALQQIQR